MAGAVRSAGWGAEAPLTPSRAGNGVFRMAGKCRVPPHVLLLINTGRCVTRLTNRSNDGDYDGSFSCRPMEVTMPLIMPNIGACLLMAVGLGAAAQALFGVTSFF